MQAMIALTSSSVPLDTLGFGALTKGEDILRIFCSTEETVLRDVILARMLRKTVEEELLLRVLLNQIGHLVPGRKQHGALFVEIEFISYCLALLHIPPGGGRSGQQRRSGCSVYWP
jgi:hypothetical protein